MEILRVRGGRPLIGSVDLSGSKNTATKLIVASLLSNKRCTFFNVPDVWDVSQTLMMCQEVGMEYVFDRQAKILEVYTPELKATHIPQRFSGSNRVPILMVGALLARAEEDITVPFSTGLGADTTPLDFHVDALKALGATIERKVTKKEGSLQASCPQGLTGAVVTLPYPSLGATENTILAAVTARGTTIIKNAAVDPEIVELMLFLQKLGANIALDVDRVITIQGTRSFHSVEHTIQPDRVEAAAFAALALGTNGRIFVRGAEHAPLSTLLNAIRGLGGAFNISAEGIEFYAENSLRGGVHIETDVHPGFLTDWQPLFVVLLTQTIGSSIVHETVFENRLGYVDTLQEMGAEISLFKQCLGGRLCRFNDHSHPHSLIVKGKTPLRPMAITIPDLRASLAYLLAAFIARGESSITGANLLTRSYEHIVEKLKNVGADIDFSSSPPNGILESPDLFSFALVHRQGSTLGSQLGGQLGGQA